MRPALLGQNDRMGETPGSFQQAPQPTARAMRRLLRKEERVFRRAAFPLYGLPRAWEGRRSLGGYGRSRRRRRWIVHSAQLLHEDIFDGERLLSVASSIPRPGEERAPADQAWQRHVDDWDYVFEDEEPEPPPRFGQEEILVDRAPSTFDIAARDEGWIGGAYVGSVWVELSGHKFDPSEVELEEVTDLEPYIEGTRRDYGI